MILISQALNFTIEKADDAATRSRLVRSSTELKLFLLSDITRHNAFRVSSQSRIIINRVWPVFVQAPGIEPVVNISQMPAPMLILLKHSGTTVFITDWQNGAALNQLIEPTADISGFNEMIVEYFAFAYDALNVQDIYNNTNASAYVCCDIEAVPYAL